MASRPTKDAPPGKEKRGPNGVASARTTTAPREGSLNSPKKATSLPRTHDPSLKKPASSTLAHKPSPLEKSKSVPNYLKSKSSTTTVPDVSKPQGKKPVLKTDSTTQKPNLVKGKSLGTPSSTSQTQKPQVSQSPTLRSSSSLSGKGTGPQKGHPDRNLRAPKEAGKQHALHARLVNATKNNSMIYVKKQEMGDSSSKAKEKIVAPDVTSVPDVLEPGTQSKEQVMVQNGDGIEKGNDNLLSENQDPSTYEQTAKIVNQEPSAISEPIHDERAGGNKNSKTATFEPMSTILEHHEPVKIDQDAGKGENKTVPAISSEGIKDPPLDDPEPINFIKHTEGGRENTDTEIVPETSIEPLEVPENQDTPVGVKTEGPEESKQEDAVNEMNSLISSDENVAGNISNNEVEEKKRVGEEVELGLSKKVEHEKEVQPVAVEAKKAVAPKVQTAHGKKDIPVSNDAIEETASKLREQRRNKVRALAGAFESVISLQESDSPKKKEYN